MHRRAWQAQRNRGGGKGTRQRDKETKVGHETRVGWETKERPRDKDRVRVRDKETGPGAFSHVTLDALAQEIAAVG